MGRNPDPTLEELELISEKFARGLSDRETLDELQDTEFPLRQPRFIRQRRLHFQAAKKVLAENIGDIPSNKLEEHQEDIRDVLRTWREQVSLPDLFLNLPHNPRHILRLLQTEGGDIVGRLSVEDDRLFKSSLLPSEGSRRHIVPQILWGKFDSYKHNVVQLLRLESSIKEHASHDAHVKTDLPVVETDRDIGLWPNFGLSMLREGWGRVSRGTAKWQMSYRVSEDGPQSIIYWGNTGVARCPVSQEDNVIEVHKTMREYYASSESMLELKAVWEAADEVRSELNEILEELISSIWYSGRCKSCYIISSIGSEGDTWSIK